MLVHFRDSSAREINAEFEMWIGSSLPSARTMLGGKPTCTPARYALDYGSHCGTYVSCYTLVEHC